MKHGIRAAAAARMRRSAPARSIASIGSPSRQCTSRSKSGGVAPLDGDPSLCIASCQQNGDCPERRARQIHPDRYTLPATAEKGLLGANAVPYIGARCCHGLLGANTVEWRALFLLGPFEGAEVDGAALRAVE